MDDTNKNEFGKVFRDKDDAGSERVGHAAEGLRIRASQQAESNVERGGHIDPSQIGNTGNSGEVRDTIRDDGRGNTSETGVGTPETGGPDLTNPTAPRSPIGPGMGCSRPAGTMFIASVWLAATVLRHRRH